MAEQPSVTSPPSDDASTVRVRVDGPVATITLNTPERLNALDVPMLRDLLESVQRLDADPTVRVIGLAGSGRGFCSGADIGTGDLADAGLDGTLYALGDLAGRGPLAAAATRQAVNAATLDLDGALTREEAGQARLLGTSDFAEGVTAFRERRSASFTGS